MLKAIRIALEKTNNSTRSAYVWNALNAVISALQNPIILLVMTRTNGVYDAGVFSIAFAIATLILYVGLYGLRRFQSSDMNEKYSFSEYHGMRILTCVAMVIISIIYCFYGMCFSGYNTEKTLIIFMICIVKVCQAYSDVYHGCMQQKGRLDVATKSSSVRYTLETVVYVLLLVITHNLLISTVAFMAASILGLLLTSVNAGKNYCSYKPSFKWSKIKTLTIEGFPLFASLFLNMYISNAPKYAIDALLTDEVQAIYNMIFMPAFVVMLISNFIFNPILTTYAQLWLDKTRESMGKLLGNIRRQCLVIAGLTLFGLIVASTIGIPVLSIVFGINLGGYKGELCIVMLGGGALAYSTYFSTVITIMRRQNTLIVCYGIISLAAKLTSGIFVKSYGIMGAASMYALLMWIMAIVLLIISIYSIRKEKNRL